MNKETMSYRLFYKMEDSISWRYFFFAASNDDEARDYAERWSEKVGTDLYGVKRVVKEVLI